MKKFLCVFSVCLVILSLTGCRTKKEEPVNSSQNNHTVAQKNDKSDFDVDLTTLSTTMIYSEVYNMMTNPDDYLGKYIRMKGNFSVYTDKTTGKSYYACVIADATACCQQGIEFVLKDSYKYPDDYPENGTEITVFGTFDTYYEGENMYCHLVDAEIAV